MTTVSKQSSYRWIVMGIVVIGTFMTALGTSVVNVSLPAIMADLGADLETIQWIITGYMIALATLMPLTAWFRDRIGYKKLFILSLIVFTAGSLLCAMAWSTSSLIAARVFQALGGGAITPTGMAMISEVFPREERGKAIGIWGMSSIIGPAIGPTIGGYLTNIFGWRSIFLINLPLGIIGITAAWMLLKNDDSSKSESRPFDGWGFAFLSVFLVSLLVGLSQGESEGWTSPFIIWCFIIAAVSFPAFLLVETHIDYGVLDLSLLKSRIFSVCMIISGVRSIILFGGMLLLPLFMQQQMGFDELQSGLLLMPGSLILAFCMPIGGKLGDKIGARIPAIIGLICLGVFMMMYSNIQPITSKLGLITPTMVRGFGMGLLMAPITAAAMNAVPLRKTGMASSMLNIIQQIGGSIGTVVFTSVLSNRSTFHLNIVGSAMKSGSPEFADAIRQQAQNAHSLGFNYADSLLAAKILVTKNIASSAVVMAFQDTFVVGAIIAIITIIPAFFLHGKEKMKVKPIEVEKEVIEEISKIE